MSVDIMSACCPCGGYTGGKLTFLTLKLTFLSLKLTFLSLKLTFLRLKLRFLRLKLRFLSIKLRSHTRSSFTCIDHSGPPTVLMLWKYLCTDTPACQIRQMVHCDSPYKLYEDTQWIYSDVYGMRTPYARASYREVPYNIRSKSCKYTL
jgi:hypothetical protein